VSAGGGLRLFGHPGTASMIPHLLLRELDAPFEWVHVDRTRDGHKAPDDLRLNPNGLIPVLVDARGASEIVLYETAAIVWHLADTHPDARLAPALGGAARAHAHAEARIDGMLDQLEAHLAAHARSSARTSRGCSSGRRRAA
jgi:glutathione S-transferase